MKRKIFSILLALVLALSLCLVTAVPVAAADITVNPGESIQAAIDATTAGDTIIVSDGTYTEDLTVNTADLTLKSLNGKGLTTIQLVDGVGIDIQAGATNFTLGGASGQGFTILGGSTTFNIQVVNAPSSVEISYNEIDTTGSASMGISVGTAGATDLSISNNTFTAEDGDGSIWGPDVVDVTVSNNVFTGPTTPTSGYAVEFSGVTGTSTISGNDITNYANGVFVFGGAPGCGTTVVSGVTISGNTISGCIKGIRVGHSSQTSAVEDVTVTGNIISNTIGANSAAIFAEEIASIAILVNTISDFDKGGIVVKNTLSVQIEGNIISNTIVALASNGIQIGYLIDPTATTGTVNNNIVSGCHWSGYDPLTETYEEDWTASGILVIAPNSALEISGNEVQNSDVGLDIETGPSTSMENNDVHDNSYGFVSWNADPAINLNNIYDNALGGVYRAADGDPTGTLDATNNWWGSASGPSGVGLGTGDAVSANVDYIPWLLEEGGTAFDKILVLNPDWSIVSPDKELASWSVVGSVGLVYAYDNGAFVEVTELDAITPVFIKTLDGGVVGFNYAESSQGIFTTDLEAGWNLIGIPKTNATPGAILSPLRYGVNNETALATLANQSNYNLSAISTFYVDAFDWANIEGLTLDPFDGYWAYMNVAKEFGVVVVPEGPG